MYILSFDLGSSGLKAALWDEGLNMVESATQSYPTHQNQPGHAEQEPEDWWRAVIACCKAMWERQPQASQRIAAMGVCGHMLGLVAVDAEGKPVMRALLHSDNRAEAERQAIASMVGAEHMYMATGNPLSANSTLAKSLWLKKHKPELYAQTACILQSKDYITGRLIGAWKSTDYSDAAHGQLMDISAKIYLETEMRVLGLDMDKYPPLYKSTDLVGTLAPQAAAALGMPAGTPVIAGGGDGACASVGAGVVKPGDTYCSLGTSGWVACANGQPWFDQDERLFNIPALDGVTNGVFGAMQSLGRSLQWAKELFGLPDMHVFNDIAAQSPPGSGGLVFLPYLDGERGMVFDALARGIFFGLSSKHGRSHFLRASMEGVCYGLCSILEVLRETQDIPAMRAVGGGAKSRLWLQILADICGIRIQTINVDADNATSRGIAAAAAVAVGILDGFEQAADSIRVVDTLEPDTGLKQVYGKGYAVYRELYRANRSLFHT